MLLLLLLLLTRRKREMSVLRIEKASKQVHGPYDYQAELSRAKVLRIALLQLHKQKAAILVCVKITTNKVHCCIADASPLYPHYQ
jgi:hypothetical protein